MKRVVVALLLAIATILATSSPTFAQTSTSKDEPKRTSVVVDREITRNVNGEAAPKGGAVTPKLSAYIQRLVIPPQTIYTVSFVTGYGSFIDGYSAVDGYTAAWSGFCPFFEGCVVTVTYFDPVGIVRHFVYGYPLLYYL